MYNSFEKHDIGTIVQIINKNNTRMYYRVKHEFVKLPIKLYLSGDRSTLWEVFNLLFSVT